MSSCVCCCDGYILEKRSKYFFLWCSYCWALVHSKNSKDVNRGLELTLALLSGDPADGRELLYLKSVAQYRLRHSLEARRTLQELLQVGCCSLEHRVCREISCMIVNHMARVVDIWAS